MARLLVVEDSDDQRMLITARLTKAGHAVVAASTATEALTIATTRGLPDLVVLDVGLPDFDGLTLLARLRALPGAAALPAIFLSAAISEADIAHGRAQGAQYLTKPVVATALLTTIDRALAAQPVPEGW